MKTMGRPILNRSPKALERDIAVMRRLRRSIIADDSIDASHAKGAVDALNNTIERLRVISNEISFGLPPNPRIEQ